MEVLNRESLLHIVGILLARSAFPNLRTHFWQLGIDLFIRGNSTQNGRPKKNNKIIFINFGGRKEKNYFFCSYFWHISLWYYSNFNRESSLDEKLNFTSNEYPLGILLTKPATPKTRNTWKNVMMTSSSHFFKYFLFLGLQVPSKVCRVSTRWMQNLISHPTSSRDRNLSKNTGRYVENTNKNNSFFMIPIPKFILKFCLRPIGYFKFKAISFANTWWHGIWIMVKRPILSWNFL